MRKYITVEELVAIHEALIEEFGGSEGLRDKEALESAAMRPQTGYYQDIIEEAAALMESLGMNHPFLDGNKRVAFFATDVFLRMNGFYLECEDKATYEYFIHLYDTSSFTFDNLVHWIKEHIKSL